MRLSSLDKPEIRGDLKQPWGVGGAVRVGPGKKGGRRKGDESW